MSFSIIQPNNMFTYKFLYVIYRRDNNESRVTRVIGWAITCISKLWDTWRWNIFLMRFCFGGYKMKKHITGILAMCFFKHQNMQHCLFCVYKIFSKVDLCPHCPTIHLAGWQQYPKPFRLRDKKISFITRKTGSFWTLWIILLIPKRTHPSK